MGYLSAIVSTVAVVPATASWRLRKRSPVTSAVLAHIALTGFIVSIAATERFAPHTHAMLGKKADGSISTRGTLLFWPYHYGLRTKLWIQRRRKTEPIFNFIVDGWYLGGWPAAEDLLPPEAALSILDCTCELPYRHKLPYFGLPIWDTYGPKSAPLNQAVLWAAEQRKAGRTVLVHCAHGHGRSTLVMCASFIHLGLARDPNEALAIIQAQRPSVRLNKRQLQALNSWSLSEGHTEAIIDPVANATA